MIWQFGGWKLVLSACLYTLWLESFFSLSRTDIILILSSNPRERQYFYIRLTDTSIPRNVETRRNVAGRSKGENSIFGSNRKFPVALNSNNEIHWPKLKHIIVAFSPTNLRPTWLHLQSRPYLKTWPTKITSIFKHRGPPTHDQPRRTSYQKAGHNASQRFDTPKTTTTISSPFALTNLLFTLFEPNPKPAPAKPFPMFHPLKHPPNVAERDETIIQL